jgi:D-sedoheptulose 7-phosphate isomerase
VQFLTNSLQEHLATIQKLLDAALPEIERSGRMICDALAGGRKILLCGNGGSAADAQHIAAVSNDLGYEQVFARQVSGLAQTGDVLVAISTSGKSKNILRAAERARELGCKSIALTGATAEPLGSLCDMAVSVPSSRTSRVQEAHITIGHLWCEMVDQLS